MIALQEMLVQEGEDCICLFPAWPEQWDVEFKLHLPGRRIIKAQKHGDSIDYAVYDSEGE